MSVSPSTVLLALAAASLFILGVIRNEPTIVIIGIVLAASPAVSVRRTR